LVDAMKSNYSLNQNNSYFKTNFFVGSGQCRKQLQEVLEADIRINQEISRVINWPFDHANIKSQIKQQILEICACCGNDFLVPTEVSQIIIKKFIVIVYKKTCFFDFYKR